MTHLRTGIVFLLMFGVAPALLSAQVSRQGSKEISTTETVSGKATIVEIDRATRMVTLRTPRGTDMVLHADDRVQRFDQLKVGDVISATYSQAVAIRVRKPGTPAPASEGEQIVRDHNSATVTKQHVATVTVDVIDLPNMMLTVKNDNGTKSSFKVKDKSNLRELKLGDKIDMTYTEGLLIKADPGQ